MTTNTSTSSNLVWEYTTTGELITTRAVEIQSGWIGQILVRKQIVWESEAQETRDDALTLANDRIVARLTTLFVGEMPHGE